MPVPTLLDHIARGLLDSENPSYTPEELEAEWQTLKKSTELVNKAKAWLSKLEEVSPESATLLKNGWLKS